MKATIHKLTPMVRHDLKELASILPYTGQDHETNLKWHYEQGGNEYVRLYVDVTYANISMSHDTELNTARIRTFFDWVGKLLSQAFEWITRLLNRLD